MERDAVPEPSAPTTFNILFVCTGNTCRSPMAEALARAELQRRGWSHVRVASAGAAADPGSAASPPAVSVMRRAGIDLAGHGSRALTPELVDWADLVLVMSPSHLGSVEAYGGGDKASLLGDFAAGAEGGGRPVRDPFGGDERAYEATRAELEHLVSRALDRLVPILQP